jgi:hypothetical protein
MEEDITLNEAKELVAKFSNPEHKNKEDELFKIAAAKLLEETDPGFEYEYEHESEEEVSVEKPDESLITRAKNYGKEVVNNIQSLGAAGTVAFSSAVYFQSVEAFETTHEIGSIIRSVESNYGQSLMSYIGSIITEMTEESDAEESQSEESDAEESQSEVEETQESESEVEETQESESEVEETQESESEVEETQESESNNTLEQPKDNNEDEHQEKTENEESAIETNGSKTKSNVQTDVIQSETNGGGDIDAINDIKPHSMIGDDAFEPVFTPHDAIVASPAGPKL